MKEFERVIPQVISENIGNYILLDGKGIMSGFKDRLTKYDILKIVGVRDDCIVVKRYMRHSNSILPDYEYDQKCRIYTVAEYNRIKPPEWNRR